MMFHIVPVEVGEEFPEPIVHNLVIAPTIPDFMQKCSATLCCRVLNGRKDGSKCQYLIAPAHAHTGQYLPFANGHLYAHVAFLLCPYVYCAHFCCAQTDNLPVPVWFVTL